MSWLEIDRDELLKVISILDLVPQMVGIPSSDYVCVAPKNGRLEMTLASSVTGVVRVKVPSSVVTEKFFVDRRLLFPFILAGKDRRPNFKTQLLEGRWLVHQGSRKAEFQLRKEPIGGYPVWRDRTTLKEIALSEDLRRMLLASNNCATGDPALPHLNCVYIGGKLVMSTNEMSLFVGVRQKEDGLMFPFPVGIIPLLGNSLVKAVGVEKDRVILDCGCGYIEGSISAIAKKLFPKKAVVEKVIKARAWPVLAKLSASKLEKILTRLTNYLTSVKREDWSVELAIADGVLKASVRVQQGKFEERMELNGNKEEGLIRWPLVLAQVVVEYMASNGELIKIRVNEEKNTPYLLSGGGVEMMVARQVGK